MKRFIKIFSVFLYFTFTCWLQQNIAFAQKPSFEFGTKLSRDTILLGDRVELSINAKLPNGFEVQFPFFADSIIQGIEVLGNPIVDTLKSTKNLIELLYKLQITSFDSGSYRIPGFKLPFSDGSMVDTVTTTPLWLVVNTLPPDTAIANIFDIKPPLRQPLTFAEVAPWLGGGILLAALIALLVYYFIRRKKDQPLFFPRKEKEPAHVTALRELEKLKTNNSWNTEHPKHYFSVLTDILRTYIEGRFDVPAMEQTTFETILNLKRIESLDSKLLTQLEDNLSLADLVKFAKLITTVNENKDSLDFGFSFVNQTMIVETVESVDKSKDEQSVNSEKVEKGELPVEPLKDGKP